ncbi:MAG: hypothetical protein IJ730_00690 [Alphaproteobacteria bacterium]|nr:hypothetical protein [Alphaproteobacteria bacterium]
MIPWDFGIIQAIKNQLDISIFPSNPPQKLSQKPHIIFEINDILQGKNCVYRVGFSLTLVNEDHGKNLEILKQITKITRNELTLKQGNFDLGSAKIKIESVENKQRKLTLDLVALLQLKIIYDDGEENAESNCE